MVGSRGWALVAALCLLGLLSACGGGHPVPGVFTERPTSSPTAVVAGAAVVPVSGRVLTAGGIAVPGAEVSVRPVRCDGCGGRLVARTDAAGAFLVEVREGVYALACRTSDGRRCRVPVGARLEVAAPVAGLRLTVAPVRHAHPR